MAVFLALAAQSWTATNFVALGRQTYRSALEAWRKDPAGATAAVAVARAACELADIVAEDDERAEIARRGIDAAREVIRREPKNAAGHYWLGMNLGELARTKMLGALPMVKEMTQAFFTARDLDEKVDYAGPDRALGLLYRDAPGWPTSVGSKTKARAHLQRAVQVSPEFPENQICLLESYEKWGDKEGFAQTLAATEKVMAAARTRFTGAEWAFNWDDWQKRLGRMQSKSPAVGRSPQPKGGGR